MSNISYGWRRWKWTQRRSYSSQRTLHGDGFTIGACVFLYWTATVNIVWSQFELRFNEFVLALMAWHFCFVEFSFFSRRGLFVKDKCQPSNRYINVLEFRRSMAACNYLISIEIFYIISIEFNFNIKMPTTIARVKLKEQRENEQRARPIEHFSFSQKICMNSNVKKNQTKITLEINRFCFWQQHT